MDQKNQSNLLCKDCKHSFRKWSEIIFTDSLSLRCRLAFHPAEIKFDPVIGPIKEAEYHDRCSSQRYESLVKHEDRCDAEGRFWEPKHKKGLFKLIAKDHQ